MSAVKRFLEQYGTRGAGLLIDKAVGDPVGAPSEAAARRVLDSVVPMLEEMLEELSRAQPVLRAGLEVGDRVVCVVRFEGTYPGTLGTLVASGRLVVGGVG